MGALCDITNGCFGDESKKTFSFFSFLRFQSRSLAGRSCSLLSETLLKKTFLPDTLLLQVHNYSGPLRVRISLVTKSSPHKPHPHELVGKDCKHGYYEADLQERRVHRYVSMAAFGWLNGRHEGSSCTWEPGWLLRKTLATIRMCLPDCLGQIGQRLLFLFDDGSNINSIKSLSKHIYMHI